MKAETLAAIEQNGPLAAYISNKGAFQRRTLPWWGGVIFKLCPYRMGQLAVVASTFYDPTAMLYGMHMGAFPMFGPPPVLKPAFDAAKAIVQTIGGWVSHTTSPEYDTEICEFWLKRGKWTILGPERVVKWNAWLGEHYAEFEQIQTMLDEAGVPREDKFLHRQGPLFPDQVSI